MKFVMIALIAFVCYASERKITKKTLGIMVGLLVLAFLGSVSGKEGLSGGCPWYSTPCADCPSACGWLYGLGCLFEDFPTDCKGLGSTGETRCDPKAQPPQKCPDGTACPDCGETSCPCTPKGCKLEEIKDCDAEKKQGVDDCNACLEKDQHALRAAGCTAADVGEFCKGGGGGDGGGDGGAKPPHTFISFTNQTGATMYIYFDKDPTTDSDRIFSPPIVAKGTTTWMVQVPKDSSFYVSSKSGTITDWLGAQCSITNKESYDTTTVGQQNMNHAGLSSFEWTIDTGGKVVAANISNVSGLNVNGTMNITGIKCDPKNDSTSASNLSTSEEACYKHYGFLTGGNNDIPTCSLKKTSRVNTASTAGLTCGGNKDGTNERDCMGCPLTEGCEWANDGGYGGACYASILKRKYGCLEWWTTNADALAWKQYNTENNSDAYWWGMGEQILGNDTYKPSIKYEGKKLEATSQALKCISNAGYAKANEKECTGYIMNNPEGSLRTCGRKDSSTPFLVSFTIKEIMKLKTL